MAIDTFRAIGLLVPYAYNKVVYAGYDANNNPASATYSQDGVTVCSIAFTYDGSGNLLTMTRS